MTVSVRQSAGVSGSNATPTLGLAPLEGSLLLCVGTSRSGATSSTISGTGWTQAVEIISEPTNSTYRKYEAVYRKVAGPSEPLSVTFDSTGSDYALLVELAGDAGETFTLEQVASAHNGAEVLTPAGQTTGTTPSVATANNLLVGCLGLKVTDETQADASFWSWTNGLVNVADYRSTGTNGMGIIVATATDAVSGTKESTATSTGTQPQRGAMNAMLVFSLGAAGPAPQTVTDSEGLLDAASRVADAARAPSDPVGAVDSATTTSASSRSAPDALTLSDQATAAVGHARTTTDAIGAMDAPASVAALSRTVVDAADVADIAIRDVAAVRDDTDPIGLADAASGQVSGAGAQTVSDAVGIADSAVTERAAARDATDQAGVSDQVTAAVSHVRSVTDALTLSDAATAESVVVLTRAVTDQVGATDAATLAAAYARALVDPLTGADDASRVCATAREHSDALGLLDVLPTVGATLWRFEVPAGGKLTADWLPFDSPGNAKVPFAYFAPSVSAPPNLYRLLDGTFTTNDSVEQAGVAKVYHGGHVHTVTDEEKALLDAAGYGAGITGPA